MTEPNSDQRGLTKQNASLTVLVASTLGASLSAVPQSQEAQTERPRIPRTTSQAQGEGLKRKSPERRASQPMSSQSDPDDCSSLDSGNRKRISLTRLHFNSKKSAGSESSRGEALTKQESFSSATTSPPSCAAMATASRQMSQTSLASDP